jgi:hypothetical protein
MEAPLLRVNAYGVTGEYMCEECLKAKEPELYRNQMEDAGSIFGDLKAIAYGESKKGKKPR